MHLQTHLAIISPLHTTLASWQLGKRHLGKTRLSVFRL